MQCRVRLALGPPQFQAVVDIGEVEEVGGNGAIYGYGDPYSIRYTIDQIQSPVVLGKVINVLNIDSVGEMEHFGGQKQNAIGETHSLKQRLSFGSVPATCNGVYFGSFLKLIEIRVRDKDSDVALQIADAIPEAFREFQFERRHEKGLRGIQVLSERYEKEEREIKSKRDLVETRRKLFYLSNPEPEEELIRTNYPEYFEAKLELEIAQDTHKLLRAKIDAEQTISKMKISDFAHSFYVTKAVINPKTAVGPDRLLGVLLVGIGLFPTVGGFLLLKESL